MPLRSGAAIARAVTLIAVVVATIAPALAQPERRQMSVAEAIQRATEGLDLSDSQESQLDAIAARYAGSEEPGVMWRVADEVRRVLNADQIAQLEEGRDRIRIERRGPRGEMRMRREGPSFERRMRPEGRRGEMRERMRHRRFERGIEEEHREEVHELMERHREAIESMRRELDSGALDDEAFRDRMREMHERMRTEMESFMTPEMRERRQEAGEQRERSRAVRDEVLRLTPEQSEEMRDGMMRMRIRINDREIESGPDLNDEQRATVSVFHALTHGGHGMRRMHIEHGVPGRMRPQDR
jgi:hypothetical protein